MEFVRACKTFMVCGERDLSYKQNKEGKKGVASTYNQGNVRKLKDELHKKRRRTKSSHDFK